MKEKIAKRHKQAVSNRDLGKYLKYALGRAGGSNGGGNESVWRQTESGSEGERTDGGALREKIEKGGTATPKERYCRSSDQQDRGDNGGRNWQLER